MDVNEVLFSHKCAFRTLECEVLYAEEHYDKLPLYKERFLRSIVIYKAYIEFCYDMIVESSEIFWDDLSVFNVEVNNLEGRILKLCYGC